MRNMKKVIAIVRRTGYCEILFLNKLQMNEFTLPSLQQTFFA